MVIRSYLQKLTRGLFNSFSSQQSVKRSSFQTLIIVKKLTMSSLPTIRESYEIIKSERDQRLYRCFKLTNELKVLLTSDPTTDKAAAALDVHVGTMLDPADLPGLAHFCEHMLFLGTDKYQEENEYSKFLSAHGGSSNAFTSSENTNFYFDVAAEHLSGALDRFAQFFLCPLFTSSATDREMNAVHSEHEKNLNADAWRLHQLERALSKPDHDFNKFGTGNRLTLEIQPKEKGINVREKLLEFHDRYYSANIMALVVIGKESLDELQEMVIDLFGKVANTNVKVPEWLDHPFGPEQLQKRIFVVPKKDIRQLTLVWPTPDLLPLYKGNPVHYMAHLLGHEGPGSLLSELKTRGWSNALVAGPKGGAKGFGFFSVSVDLTPEGLDHVDDIVKLVYECIELLRKEGIQRWIFDECRDLGAMQFRFKEKERPSSFVSSVASSMHDYEPEHVLCANYIITEFRPDWIENILKCLVPAMMRMTIVAKHFEPIATLREHWYGTEYQIEDIDPVLIAEWSTVDAHHSLSLPPPNEFIPTDFSLIESAEAEEPQLLKETPFSKLWHAPDRQFLLPKVFMSMHFRSSMAYFDPLSANLTSLFTDLLRDALNEFAYAAELAGLEYSFKNTSYGLLLTFRGYHHKLDKLMMRIMERMVDDKFDAKRFEILKENYKRMLENFSAEQPYQHAIYYTNVITTEVMWSKHQLLDALPLTTFEALTRFLPEMLSRLHLETLAYGNIDDKNALRMVEQVESIIQSKYSQHLLQPSQLVNFRQFALGEGESFTYQDANQVHDMSAVESYFQCSVQDTHSNMLLELFAQVIFEPCFNILRTQEQLGYIVFSGVRRQGGVQGLRLIVQSDKTASYLDERVEQFLADMDKTLQEMTDEEFYQHVSSLRTRILEKPKKMSEQNSKYWTEIFAQHYNFSRDQVEADHLQTISKEQVIQFYNTFVRSDAPERKKLVVYISPKIQPLEPTKAKVVTAIDEWKKTHSLYPLPVPCNSKL